MPLFTVMTDEPTEYTTQIYQLLLQLSISGKNYTIKTPRLTTERLCFCSGGRLALETGPG